MASFGSAQATSEIAPKSATSNGRMLTTQCANTQKTLGHGPRVVFDFSLPPVVGADVPHGLGANFVSQARRRNKPWPRDDELLHRNRVHADVECRNIGRFGFHNRGIVGIGHIRNARLQVLQSCGGQLGQF